MTRRIPAANKVAALFAAVAIGAVGFTASPAGAQTPTQAQKKEAKVKGGVRVESVTEGAAQRAGVREGDIIVAIGNTEINSVREFDTVVARMDKNKAIPVLLRRGELASYLLIRPARG